jgi:Arc/MetJ-type ribon-helix-helix transcriptional regulator
MLRLVARLCYISPVSTTTVRLDESDEALLDALAGQYGGRSSAIRAALRALAAERERHVALRSFLEAWDAEAGPIDEAEVAAMARRYGL